MSTYPIPATVEIRRGRFFGLVAVVAVLAAAVTWIIVQYGFDNGNSTATSSVQASEIVNPLPPATMHFQVVAGPNAATSAAQDARKVPSIMTLTPARLAAGALGTSYALPTTHNRPTTASILASMSPQTRQYTKRIINLTFTQLAAGAAGQP